MDLELKLRIAGHEFHLTKDRSGHLFQSRETETMFVLTVHLKGYRKEDVQIDINEDGSRIAISGERAVQETIIVGWKVVKKETEIKKIRKVFRIPSGVILDKIEAKFDEAEFVLTVWMPKEVEGIRGTGIEEVEEEQVSSESSGSYPRDEIPRKDASCHDEELSNNTGGTQEEEGKQSEGSRVYEVDRPISEKPDAFEETPQIENKLGKETGIEQGVVERTGQGSDHATSSHATTEEDEKMVGADQVHDEIVREQSRAEAAKEGAHEGESPGTSTGERLPVRRCKLCDPVVAGPALVLSLIVFVIHIFRTKNQHGRKRD